MAGCEPQATKPSKVQEAEVRVDASGPKPPRVLVNPAVEERENTYWKRAADEVYKEPDASKRGPRDVLPKLIRGNVHENTVLLTFDDGPHPAYTPKLLKILADAHVPATFFVIGKVAERNPDLIQAIAAGGHTIGNHSFSHVTLTKIPEMDVRTEYRANNDLIEQLTGKRMRFCRPPGGDYDAAVIRAAVEEGLTTVLWSDDPGDYANPGDDIVLGRTLKRISNGGVILLHDGSPDTIDILPKLIAEVQARGYRFVSPEDMVDRLGPLVERAKKGGAVPPLRRRLTPVEGRG